MTKTERKILIYIARVVREMRASGVPLLVPWEQRDINRLLRAIKEENADDC